MTSWPLEWKAAIDTQWRQKFSGRVCCVCRWGEFLAVYDFTMGELIGMDIWRKKTSLLTHRDKGIFLIELLI